MHECPRTSRRSCIHPRRNIFIETVSTDHMRFQQWQHVNDVLEHPLEDSYQTKVIEGFKWAEWIDGHRDTHSAGPIIRTSHIGAGQLRGRRPDL